MSAAPRLAVRWSEHEARKPYARPFGLSFSDDSGADLGGVALSGADLLYYRQLQAAVLSLAGVVYRDPRVEGRPDPQRAWLDVLAGLVPAASGLRVQPVSELDQVAGRVFAFEIHLDGMGLGRVGPAELLSYQDLQAVLAHRSGRLWRRPPVEGIADPVERHASWMQELSNAIEVPAPGEAMAPAWPWG